MHASIKLKLGTLKGSVKARLCTTWNPIRICGIICIKLGHAYRVNQLKELAGAESGKGVTLQNGNWSPETKFIGLYWLL